LTMARPRICIIARGRGLAPSRVRRKCRRLLKRKKFGCVIGMRALLRYAKEIKVEVGLRELIADAEERLEILEQRQNQRPPQSS
jgi:hypothetical protein